MECDYVGLVAPDPPKLAITIRHIAMRGPVKPVAAYSMAAIKLIRKRVEVGLLGKCLMKRRIKHGNRWKTTTKHLSRRHDALDVCGVVQRRQVDAILDAAHHFIGDQNRMREALATVHHPVADGMDVRNALKVSNARLRGAGPANDELNSSTRVAQGSSRALRFTTRCLE